MGLIQLEIVDQLGGEVGQIGVYVGLIDVFYPCPCPKKCLSLTHSRLLTRVFLLDRNLYE